MVPGTGLTGSGVRKHLRWNLRQQDSARSAVVLLTLLPLLDIASVVCRHLKRSTATDVSVFHVGCCAGDAGGDGLETDAVLVL